VIKRLFNYKNLNLLVSISLLFLKCSCYEDVHIVEWHSAFFIDSVTVGVIGWELDSKQATTDWAYTEFSNVNQYFYTYNIPTKNKTLVKELHSNCSEVSHSTSAKFSYPNVYYTTWYNKGDKIARYNMETEEIKILVYGCPISVSGNNKYLITGTYSDYPARIFDLTTETTIDSFHSFLKPKYINDITKKVFMFGNEVSYAGKWLLIYDMETKVIDTIGENVYGYYKGLGDYGKVIIFQDRVTEELQYIIGNDLINKTFEAVQLYNVTKKIIYSFDIDLSSGYYVFQSGGDIVLGRNQEKVEDVIIFSGSRTPL